jgi:uracil-DNA glycosylase
MPNTTADGAGDSRVQRMKRVADQVVGCRRCKGMNVHGITQAAPGFGSVRSPVVIVGQSLCGPCMAAQEPFVGGSGALLDAAFDRARIEKPRLFITNVVHCHPPQNNKSLPEWIKNCSPYLHEELEIVQPRLVIGLGKDAEAALRVFYPRARELSWPFRTPHVQASDTAPRLHFLKHPSYIKRLHDDWLERQYVASLARALRWGFGDVGPN